MLKKTFFSLPGGNVPGTEGVFGGGGEGWPVGGGGVGWPVAGGLGPQLSESIMSSMAMESFFFPLTPYTTICFHSTQNKQIRVQSKVLKRRRMYHKKRIVQMNGEYEYGFEITNWYLLLIFFL